MVCVAGHERSFVLERMLPRDESANRVQTDMMWKNMQHLPEMTRDSAIEVEEGTLEPLRKVPAPNLELLGCTASLVIRQRRRLRVNFHQLYSCSWPAMESAILKPSPLGLKGAALAAFGESPRDFAAVPFTARDEVEAGVKLGESTFRRFLRLKRAAGHGEHCYNFNQTLFAMYLSDWVAIAGILTGS